MYFYVCKKSFLPESCCRYCPVIYNISIPVCKLVVSCFLVRNLALWPYCYIKMKYSWSKVQVENNISCSDKLFSSQGIMSNYIKIFRPSSEIVLEWKITSTKILSFCKKDHLFLVSKNKAVIFVHIELDWLLKLIYYILTAFCFPIF